MPTGERPAESVRLDLNSPEFQAQLFALPKEGQTTVLSTLAKLSRMTWTQVYGNAGLRWEKVHSLAGPEGAPLYSLRVGKGFRAIAVRKGPWLRVLSLHPDHDSAYFEHR